MNGDAEFRASAKQTAVFAELLERLGAAEIESNDLGWGNGRVVFYVRRLVRGKPSEDRWVVGPLGGLTHYLGDGRAPTKGTVAMREAGPS